MRRHPLRRAALSVVIVGAAFGCASSASPNPTNDGLSEESFGGYGGNGGPGTAGFGNGPVTVPPGCGNGLVDGAEACDGVILNGATCAAATMNAKPLGSVHCSQQCQLDVSGCSANGSGPNGGPATGGFGGTGPGNNGGGNAPGGAGVPNGTAGTPAGNGGTGAGGAGNGGSGGTPVGSGSPKLPTATGSCPTFTNGGTVQIARANGSMMPVVIYIDPGAKNKPAPGGPIILYYHATASSPAEVHQGFGDANISKVTAMGGVVAAFTTTACSGCAGTDDGYWFVEDNVVQDTIVACAIQQAKIDPTHIHALGWSAGALHTDTVAMLRSNYMASVISYSGGYGPWPGTMTPQDPNNHVASIQTYGDSTDVVVINFPTQSKQWYTTFQPMGYYTMMCNHPGGHEIDPGVAPVSLTFFMAHPYKVSPEPYASAVPSGFPSYCKNAP